VDAKLCSRKQELHCLKQELLELTRELESERKQQLQLANPDLQDPAAERVFAVCFQYYWSMTLSNILLSFCWSVFSRNHLCFATFYATKRNFGKKQ